MAEHTKSPTESAPPRRGLERSLYFGSVGFRRYREALFLKKSVKRVDVNAAGLILDNGDSREAYAFSDVAEVKFFWLPGFVFEVQFNMNDGRKLKLPSVVERLDYPLDLFATARPELAASDEFAFYRRVAISLDHSWARFGQTMQNPWLGLSRLAGRFLFSMVCAIAVTSIGQQMGYFATLTHLSSWFLWLWEVAFMSMIVWTMSHAAFETHFFFKQMRRLKADPYAVRREMDLEKRSYAQAVRFTYAGALVCAVFIATLASHDSKIHDDEITVAEQRVIESNKNSPRIPTSIESVVKGE